MYQVKNQLTSKVWQDEAGNSIPLTHIKPVEKINEKVTVKVATQAIKVSEQLSKLKALIAALVMEAFNAFLKQYNGSKEAHKGNITVYNFDRSIKVEMRVSDAIQFDDLTIMAAKAKLESFLRDGITAKDDVIKEMVLEAFSTARGKLDVKKILGLKRYADRINDDRYAEAMKLIDQAIRRPDSATYYRVWIKNEAGEYEAIPLALADVKG
jgi:hypothetical protein